MANKTNAANHAQFGDNLQAVAEQLGGPVLVAKGAVDTVCSAGTEATVSREEGAPRRCGGQGDLLSGILGTTISWAIEYSRTKVRLELKGSPFRPHLSRTNGRWSCS
jgi:NAD(P)H-hydrate repair Nnr-like enzyme with NAD(P)H-hydrate dehydratase domain